MERLPRWNTGAETAARGALLITALYVVIALVWTWASGSFPAARSLNDPIGWALVAATALAIFAVSYRTLRIAVQSGELEALVSYDGLTGLPNSALLATQMNRALLQAQERRNVIAVLAIHVADLRQVNEQHGADAGDRVLQTVAERLRRAVSGGDLLARHEGSAFIVVLDGSSDAERPEAVSRAVMQSMAEPILIGSTEFRPQASIGISRYPDDGETPRELLAAAVSAMNRARSQGAWHVHHQTARITRAAVERFRLENDLRRAIEQDGLALEYQPQVRLADGEAVGVECLVRWTHPDLGPVPPNRFIPLAEESGLIVPLGEWVLRQACRQVANWHSEGIADLRVAVNLSARQFGQPRLWRFMDQALKEAGLPADRLEIEITESVVARDPDATLRIMRQLKEVGVSIALANFGMGRSSLSHLQLLPVDRLKVDRSFVGALGHDPRGEAICRTILDMGRHLILMTLAEGVETEEQRRLLLDLGCVEGQGFLFARPMKGIDVPPWLGIEPVRGERRPFAALAV